MSLKSPMKEIKLLTIEEVDFNLPEIEPSNKEKDSKLQKSKKQKPFKTEFEENKESKEKKKNNRIKR